MNALQRIVRATSVASLLALVTPSIVAGPAVANAAADGDSEEPAYDYGAKVKIELRMENGDIVKHRGEMRSYGSEWRFEFDGADHHHVLTLTADGDEDDKQLDVTVGYERDAEEIIAPYTSSWPVRKRDVLWDQHGKVAVALTFLPTKFEREDKSRDDQDKIKPDDGDDPLGGNPLL